MEVNASEMKCTKMPILEKVQKKSREEKCKKELKEIDIDKEIR